MLVLDFNTQAPAPQALPNIQDLGLQTAIAAQVSRESGDPLQVFVNRSGQIARVSNVGRSYGEGSAAPAYTFSPYKIRG